MWICFNDAFLSAVKDWNRADGLVVRARVSDHLARTFPDRKIVATPSSDYAFRVFVPKAELADLLNRRVGRLAYPNFKDSVQNPDLHELYAEFWLTHRQYQRKLTGDFES